MSPLRSWVAKEWKYNPAAAGPLLRAAHATAEKLSSQTIVHDAVAGAPAGGLTLAVITVRPDPRPEWR
ncbi:hypothetical protein AB0F72_19235 [Actinoplanes sp. NPDC023936]|uniref:hypothetical protein n=1 Tax=Actinoplanes sp. NPDC023936 TaxID=3154910 RepID=UPI0033FD30EC